MSSLGPSHLGRYAVRRRIGSGGFATVWLAYDEQLDAPVAVKVLADNWSEQHEVRTRFVEEGRYLRRVESPHVVPVYDAGALDDGRPYLVMAYADQGTLADRLASGGVTVPQALEVVSQVGAGLQALHDRGVLHRDVKPANVLFRTIEGQHGSGEVRAMVGDLGLGKALDVSSRLTMIAGTPAYVAPEQAQGETPDARADQFSLGVLTFLLLSGRLPWNHGSLSSAAAPTDPLPLSTPDRTLPEGVEAVVRRALAHDREYRWPSVAAYVAELTAALDAWDSPDGGVRALPVDPALTQPGERPAPLSSTGPLPDPVPPRRPSRAARSLAVAATVVVALAAGAAGGYYGQQAGASEPEPEAATVEDESGQLEVTVPPGWDARSGAPWMPPNATDTEYAALSVGTSTSWTTDGEGIFLGLLPGTELPDAVPGHQQCTSAGEQQRDELGPEPPSVTVFYAGCSGDAAVIVERVVRVNDGQLLWVQLRSSDRGAAVRVLDAVRTYGL